MASRRDFHSELDHFSDLVLKGEETSSRPAYQAVKLELQKQKTCLLSSWNATTATSFEQLMDEIVLELQPTYDDYYMRLDVVKRVSAILGSLDTLRAFTILPFGSFESNLYTRWGDLDLSMDFAENWNSNDGDGKMEKISILKLAKKILSKSGEAGRVQLIPRARIPLLTFKDSYTNIYCDLSVDNGVAFLKSRLLRWICDIDQRCRSLIFLVKCWAKAHCINDSKMGTLNSYALSLLVIFHLQTREKPILPPLSAIIQEDIASKVSGQCRFSRKHLLEECWEKIQIIVKRGFGTDNKSSVADLFVSFFCQFSSVSDLWLDGLIVCTFTGAWADGTTLKKWRGNHSLMTVEDPFDRSENCARSVQEHGFCAIRHAFSSALQGICHTPRHQNFPLLREILFCWPAGSIIPGTRPWVEDKAVVMLLRSQRNQKNVLHKKEVKGSALEMTSGNIRKESAKMRNFQGAPLFKEYAPKDTLESFQPIMVGSVTEGTTTYLPIKFMQAQSDVVVTHFPNMLDNNPQITMSNNFYQRFNDSSVNMNFTNYTGKLASETSECSSLMSKESSRSSAKSMQKEKHESFESKIKFIDSNKLPVKSVVPTNYGYAQSCSDTDFQRGSRKGKCRRSRNGYKYVTHSVKQAGSIGELEREYRN